MLTNRVLGWTALVVFAGAVTLTVALVVYVFFVRYASFDAQLAILGIGILALGAAVLGFCAFRTTQGRVAGVGGLALLLVVVLVLSWTSITTVRSGPVGAPGGSPPPGAEVSATVAPRV